MIVKNNMARKEKEAMSQQKVLKEKRWELKKWVRLRDVSKRENKKEK